MRVDNEVIEVCKVNLDLDDIFKLIDQETLVTHAYPMDEFDGKFYQVRIRLDYNDCLKLKFVRRVLEGYSKYEDNNPRDGDRVPGPNLGCNAVFT